MSAGAAIEIRELRKVYKKGKRRVEAVNGLDLDAARGEVFGLLGPNGAGKTTTVEICEGLLDATSGEVRILGRKWSDPRPHDLRARIGVTLQETQFFSKQTVRETLTLFRSLYPEGGRSVLDCIDLLALQEKADARVKDLSGGQRQRLAVACALLGSPELLFLDEPTTGLDPQSRRKLWDVIEEFRSQGGTVLLTTHYMEEAEQLCDRVGIVDHGVLIALGSPSELIATLGSEHVVEVRADSIDRLRGAQPEAMPGVRRAEFDGDALCLWVDAPHVTVPPLLEHLDAHGVEMDGLTTRHTSLEDVFVSLTGRHLRDEE